MSYTYPETHDAMGRVLTDIFTRAGHPDVTVRVMPDAVSGTASVKWEHHGAFLKEVTVFLPVQPANSVISVQEFRNYAGLSAHEAYHPLETDKRTWDLACATGRNALLNALEDVRIEKCAIDDGKVVPNALAVFSDLVRVLDYTCDKPGFDPNDPKMIGFVMGFLGRANNGYDMDAGIVTRRLRPGSAVSKVLKWALPALAKCRSTKQCLALADRIVAALPAKVQAPQPQPQPQQPQQGEQPQQQPQQQQQQPQQGEGEQGEGEQGEGEQAPSEASSSEGEQGEGEQAPSEASSSEGEQGGKHAEGQPEQGDGASSSEQNEGRLDPKDIKQVDLRPGAEKALQQDTPEAIAQAQVINVIREAKRRAAEKLPAIGASDPTYSPVVASASKASRQRALLARALKAEDIDGFDGGMRRGLLDKRGIANAAAGNAAVFGRRTLVEGYETDVVVIVDGSGSMFLDRRIDKAASMALVIAQAAAQVGVSCSTYMFGANYGGGAYELVEIKQGRGKPNAGAFASIPAVFGGDTELCRSMLLLATQQVARAPHKRRVMFVVSDGMCCLGKITLKATAAYVEDALGVEVANLSIGATLKGCFRNEVYVSSDGDVSSVGLEMLTAKLARGLGKEG